MSNKVRVMRILVYEGTREWVEDTLKRSAVPLDGVRVVSDKKFPHGNCIKSALVDKFPEILEQTTTEEEEVT